MIFIHIILTHETNASCFHKNFKLEIIDLFIGVNISATGYICQVMWHV